MARPAESSTSSVDGAPRSADLPQVDAFDRIVEALRALRENGEISERTIELSQRHVNYVKHAARILGLLTPGGAITDAGRRLSRAKAPESLSLLRAQFEQSKVGRAWIAWAGAISLTEVAPESAADFLRSLPGLPESMAIRRGRTLRRWCTTLKSAVLEDPRVEAHRRPRPGPSAGRPIDGAATPRSVKASKRGVA